MRHRGKGTEDVSLDLPSMEDCEAGVRVCLPAPYQGHVLPMLTLVCGKAAVDAMVTLLGFGRVVCTSLESVCEPA